MKAILFTLALAVITLAVTGCGGGTTGTGGLVLKGAVRTGNGSAVPGAAVTVLETGDSARTDDNGAFSIDLPEYSSTVSLLIESEQLSASTTLTDLPEDAEEVTFDVRVDWESNRAETENVQVRKKTPQASSSSSAAAAPGSSSSTVSSASSADSAAGGAASSSESSLSGQNEDGPGENGQDGNGPQQGQDSNGGSQGENGGGRDPQQEGGASKPDKPENSQNPDKPEKPDKPVSKPPK